jgi:hypothetical protein
MDSERLGVRVDGRQDEKGGEADRCRRADLHGEWHLIAR